MKNEELMQRLFELAEKQQANIDALNAHVSTLEDIIQAQQRTIDNLAAMAQPVFINNGNGVQLGNNCDRPAICGNRYENGEIYEGAITANVDQSAATKI